MVCFPCQSDITATVSVRPRKEDVALLVASVHVILIEGGVVSVKDFMPVSLS